MKSLKQQLCLDIVRRSTLNLRQFVELIRNPTSPEEELLAQSCWQEDNSRVWGLLIDRSYTPTLLLSRMDISPDDYGELARKLLQNVTFDYTMLIDVDQQRVLH